MVLGYVTVKGSHKTAYNILIILITKFLVLVGRIS
jgi:hypothetical protein